MVTRIKYPEPLLTLGFEKNFDTQAALKWMNDNWHIPYLFVILFYLPLIFIGPIIMKNREPFKLRIPLMLWNGSLALFSILGFIHILPETIYALKNYGLFHTVCNSSFIYHKSASYWHFLFSLSKIPELIDTVFLVLGKKKLIFLHTFHHATVVLFAWFHYASLIGASRWYNTMNYGIHSIMYTYYFLKTMPHLFRIPKWVSMFITSMQTIQMVFGTSFVVAASYYLIVGVKCDATWPLAIFGSIVYASFLYLFAKFFYDAYMAPKTIKSVIRKEA